MSYELGNDQRPQDKPPGSKPPANTDGGAGLEFLGLSVTYWAILAGGVGLLLLTRTIRRKNPRRRGRARRR